MNGGRNSKKIVGVIKFGYMLKTLAKFFLQEFFGFCDNKIIRDNQQERLYIEKCLKIFPKNIAIRLQVSRRVKVHSTFLFDLERIIGLDGK